MNGIVSGFLEKISEYGTVGINILGVALLIGIIVNMGRLKSQKDQIESVFNYKTTKPIVNEKIGRMEEHVERREPEWNELIEREKGFSKVRSWYEVCAQCVTLFPLLGILGTVAGLMLQVNAQNLDEMMGSLDTALGTTLWGLIWAIFLKFIMAFFSARIIFDVDALLDNYFQGFDRSVALKNVTKD